jgi:hypothetical protein
MELKVSMRTSSSSISGYSGRSRSNALMSGRLDSRLGVASRVTAELMRAVEPHVLARERQDNLALDRAAKVTFVFQ